jgi:hypothetical protein
MSTAATNQPAAATNDVLELRIHGVSNTPPKSMLDLPETSIEQVEGDDLGSFWRPAEHALDKLTEADRGYVPPGITREAYSWGGLARTSIGGTSAIGKILNVAGRFGWSLLLPFGLVNVAYWSRRLGETSTPLGTDDEANAYDSRRPTLDPLTFTSRRGGAALRLAGLLMTLLTASTAAVVTMDYLGVQCFSSTTARCASLPSWVGFLYGWSLTRRLALLSLLPVALVAFLWWLASRSRTRYEQATRDQGYGTGSDEDRTPDASRANPRWPLLSTPGFWNHSVISGATSTLHLTAVALFITLASSWHMRFGASDSCATFQTAVFGAVCRGKASQGSAMAGSPVVIGAALVLLVVVALLVLVRSDDAADIKGPELSELGPVQRGLRGPLTQKVVVVVSGVLFVTQLGLLYFADTSFPVRVGPGTRIAMVGLSAAVLVVLALLVGVGLSALSWRHVAEPYPVIAGVVLAVALLGSGAFDNGAVQWTLRVVALMAFVTVLVPVFMDEGLKSERRRYEMWGGCAPGVLLLLGTALCLVIAGAVVVTVGNILNGNFSPASLAGLPELPSPAVGGGCDQQCDPHTDFLLSAPRPYVWFGALTVIGLFGFALLVIAAVGLQWLDARHIARTLPAGRPEGPAARAGGRSLRGGHMSDTIPAEGPLAKAVATARMWARLAHRAEKGIAVLAYFAAAGLVLAIVASVSDVRIEANPFVSGVMGWGMWALVGVGLGVVAMATGSGGTGGAVAQRPLGLVWDLICFLPRAGHPFGPPCYAERVVPELLGRYRWWLTEEGTRGDDAVAASPRRIVLAAHSLGSVLAAATLLATSDRQGAPAMVPHLSLITYGTQLRAYFSRLFPELLGPHVLGSPPCLGADLTTADPWHSERADTKPRTTVYAGSVRAHLDGTGVASGRWLSLWHLTDPLGFPIHRYPPTPSDTEFDTYADEVDRTAYLLATLAHSDYPRAEAYAEVLAELSAAPAP